MFEKEQDLVLVFLLCLWIFFPGAEWNRGSFWAIEMLNNFQWLGSKVFFFILIALRFAFHVSAAAKVKKRKTLENEVYYFGILLT